MNPSWDLCNRACSNDNAPNCLHQSRFWLGTPYCPPSGGPDLWGGQRLTEAQHLTQALGGEWRGHSGLAPCPVCQPERRHHTRKPTPGIAPTLDDSRGGSALRGVARFNRLLVPMTESEGAQAGVDDFRLFFRIGDVASNLAPPSSDRNCWFEKLGVAIGNGENVATIRPWTWPDHFAGVTVSDACRVCAAIANRDPAPRQSIQAADWVGHVVAEVLGLDVSKKSDKARISSMLKTWIATGVLGCAAFPIGKNRRSVPCIILGQMTPRMRRNDGPICTHLHPPATTLHQLALFACSLHPPPPPFRVWGGGGGKHMEPPPRHLARIHPVKAVGSSSLTVAFHGDHLAEIFDTELGEGQDLGIGGAVYPDHAIFGLHSDGEVMEPIDIFAEFCGDTIDGFDGIDLIQMHGQAASAMC
jgi:hypothetical protein